MARYEKLQELFDRLWRTREPLPLESLCSDLDASPATVKRLIAVLRRQRGLVIHYQREQNGYVLERSPQDASTAALLGLSAAEVTALLEAEAILEQLPLGTLREDTADTRATLARIRKRHLGHKSLADRIQLRFTHLRQTSVEGFRSVLAALRSRRRLGFRYRSRGRNEERERTCSPARLTFYKSNWYLAAWCHESQSMRVFSVDRMEAPTILEAVAYDPPEELVRAELDTSYGIFTGEANQIAVLRFNEIAARWVAQERWHEAAEVEPCPDGGVILRIPYNRNTELIMEILRYGADCEVLEPPSLREAVRSRLQQAVERYQRNPR